MDPTASSRVARAAALALALAAPAAAGSLGGPNWPRVPITHIDPQIAAGPNHILITQYDHVYYFDKSGRQITHVGDDPARKTLVSYLEELFEPIRDDADAHLELPPGASCNRAHRGEPSYEKVVDGRKKTVSNYCLSRFGYDARVLYDEYRERFVIVAVAINESAKCKFNPGESNYFARRNKILVAYSATSDPTDGRPWQLTWFDAVPGESCTTQKCRDDWGWQPGTASDYPTVAVTKDYLLVTINNQMHEKLDGDRCPAPVPGKDYEYEDKFVGLPSIVHVWSTKALSTGKFDRQTCNGLCSWVYHNGDIRGPLALPVYGSPTLAQTHGEPYLGSAWFASPDGTGSLNLWHFSVQGSDKRPPLRHGRIQIPAFATLDFHNSFGRDGRAPLQINGTSSLVQRGTHFFYADVGATMKSMGGPAIRLVALREATPGVLAVGRNAIFGEPLQGYGSPALEVNADNDIVLVYRKVGQGAGPGFGARYLVWKRGDATPPGGRTLADDETDLPCPDKECDALGDFDTAGIALAPQGRVYVMLNYIDKGTRDWAYAVNYVVP
jgi:hypothetical protein